jgi:hypothetical protein
MGLKYQIYTPGSKKRLLFIIRDIENLLECDADREHIMFKIAELMPLAVNQFACCPSPIVKKKDS